jgi:hypothetical protein
LDWRALNATAPSFSTEFSTGPVDIPERRFRRANTALRHAKSSLKEIPGDVIFAGDDDDR